MLRYISLMGLGVALTLEGSALAQSNEVVPYVECQDTSDQEILLSKSPDESVFLYTASTHNGLASRVLQKLHLEIVDFIMNIGFIVSGIRSSLVRYFQRGLEAYFD